MYFLYKKGIQVILGQFLDASNFHTGAIGDQNGTSNIPTSTIFYSLSSNVGVNQLTLADISVTNTNINSIPTNTFNCVRPGPMMVKIDYTGRADAAAGTISAGICIFEIKKQFPTSLLLLWAEPEPLEP